MTLIARFGCLCLLICIAAGAAAEDIYAENLRIDTEAFENCESSALDHQIWTEIAPEKIPQRQHFCLRATFAVSADQARQPLVLKLSMLAASHIYWDGVLVGRNGQLGTDQASEIPGEIDYALPIPAELTSAGKHLVTIKASSYHLDESLHSIFYYFVLEPFSSAMDWSFQKMLVASLFMGGLLFAALVFQVLYWRYQRNSYHLVLCALCVASVLLLLAEKWRTAFGYSYDMHLLRLHLVVAMTYITCLLLVVFYVVYYQFKHKLRWVAVIATVLLAASLAPISYDGKSVVLFCVALVSVLSISIYGVINRWRSAWGSLLGMTMVTLLYLQSPDKFLEDKFALASLVVVALALLAVVNDMRQSRAQALASARMEAELLRRNLQPHFLMNSLMLVIEWIEQKPAAASAFVQALADELGMLVRFSSLQKITLDEEISLCERHLKIMAYRYAANYSLVITGSTAGIALPPAVIHAQIENAFSHNRLPLDAVFSLAIYRDKNRVRLELRSPRSTRPEQPVKAKPVSAGFGEHYISTRLQECFADRYRFESFADGDLWTSVIEFEERT